MARNLTENTMTPPMDIPPAIRQLIRLFLSWLIDWLTNRLGGDGQ